VAQVYYRSVSREYTIDDIDIYGASFLDFRTAVLSLRAAIRIQSCNVFLNWFKVVGFMSDVPAFGLLMDTFLVASGPLLSFTAVFLVVFYGFCQAHTMLLGSTVAAYKTVGISAFTLIQATLGSFDFDEMYEVEQNVGAIFFLVFIVIGVLMLLNIIIAIIADAYSEANDRMEKKIMEAIENEEKPMPVVMAEVIWGIIIAIPIVGVILEKMRIEGIEKAKLAADLAAEAAQKANEAAKVAAEKSGANQVRQTMTASMGQVQKMNSGSNLTGMLAAGGDALASAGSNSRLTLSGSLSGMGLSPLKSPTSPKSPKAPKAPKSSNDAEGNGEGKASDGTTGQAGAKTEGEGKGEGDSNVGGWAGGGGAGGVGGGAGGSGSGSGSGDGDGGAGAGGGGDSLVVVPLTSDE